MNHGVVLRDEIGIDIKYEQENIRGYKVVRDGDYIVHLRSFQGGFAFSRLNGICSPAYTILRPQPNMLEYGFLESYFYSSRFITSLKQVTYGIRDGRSISIGEWMQEKTSLPTLPEQRKIAALLSLIDERIEVQNAIIKEQEVAKTSLIRRLFDRTLRFPEFTDEWKECQISDYGTVVTGSTPSTKDVENYEDDGFLWASPADIDGSKFIERTKITLSSKGFNRTRKLPPLSVLVVCIGSIGKIAMAKNEMATNQQINSIVVNPLHSPEFVYYAIISRFRSYLSAVAVQVVPIISKSTFERLPNSTTSLPEQRKIAALLSAVDEQIAVEKEYATLLQKQKAYLLRQMFV